MLATDISITLSQEVEKNLFFQNKMCGVVYSDMEYDASIIFEEEIKEIKVFINDTYRECFYNNGKLSFNATNFLDKRIFLNYFGYVSFTINIKTATGDYEFYSNYLDVAVRDNISSELIRKMINYIAENSQKYLFKEEDNIKDFVNVEKSKNKNINTEISMLENILFEYENNFKFFKTNSKFKLVNNYVNDDFNKLKEINKQTIQHIISNPQNLETVNYSTGIIYNKMNLQPKKTLVNINEMSFDIYENQVILGFLKYIYQSVSSKITDVESKINDKQMYSIKAEYISSSSEIYKGINNILNKYKVQLLLIKTKVQELYFMYKQTLKCEEIHINNIPRPSSIFMEVQHYRKLYKVIKDWFESGNYDLRNEMMILTFSEASKIYEYYILFKMNKSIIERGYYLKESKKFTYKLKKNAKYENTRYENTFVFQNQNTDLTLYYQPVIYLEPVQHDNKISLFRNNDLSFEGGRGQYYTPDYVIKISSDEGSNYIILDAKWATIDSVINHSIKKIIHNYIFSISTLNSKDKIIKIWIVNGKQIQNQEEFLYDIYNSKYRERTCQLTPSVKVLTLNPNIEETVETDLLNELFANCI